MFRVLPVVALGLLLSACGVIYQQEVKEQSFQTSSSPLVVVDNVSGHLSVGPSTGNEVLVTIIEHGTGNSSGEARERLKALQVELSQEKDTVTLTTRRESGNAARAWAEVELKVPSQATLSLRTGDGRITTRGLSGALTLITSEGSIQVDGDSHYLRAETRSGRISLSSGRAAQVEARTTNGEILYTGALAGEQHVFETTSGNVTLSLPPDSAFRLEASTSTGRVDVGFPLVAENQGLEHVRGTVGHAPEADITIRVTNGNIAVRPDENPSPPSNDDDDDEDDDMSIEDRKGPGSRIPEPAEKEVPLGVSP